MSSLDNNSPLSTFQIHDVLSSLTSEPIRKGFGIGLKEIGETNSQIVALCADLTESTQMHLFKESFPDRYFEVGVAEQNLVTVASGLAATGFTPFVTSYAAFSPGRNWEQIRTTICLNDRPVKIIGSHAGVSVGPDGATHQMLEDIALMRVLPNMVVLAPADSLEAKKATIAMANNIFPNYMRLAREATPVFTTDETPFEIGKAYIYEKGEHATIVATGTMTYQALVAARQLKKNGISVEVVHCPTIKPLDTETILRSAQKTRLVITCEEAQINGGLGGAVAELLSEYLPTRLFRIGMRDRFGESGTQEELLDYFELSSQHIKTTIKRLLNIHHK